MTTNLLLLILEVWILSVVALGLHYLSPRYGLAPLTFFLGALIAVGRFSSSWSIYLRISDDLIFTLTGNLFIPVVLLSVLTLYVANGTSFARITILSLIGINILTHLIMFAQRQHLGLAGGESFIGLSADSLLLNPRLRWQLASDAALITDFFVIILVYQVLSNHAIWLPKAGVIGISLLAVFLSNAIVFQTLSSESITELVEFLPGDLVGKMFLTSLLWPITAYYLVSIAPRLKTYVGSQGRPVFDLFIANRQKQLMVLPSEDEIHGSEIQYQQILHNINEVLWLSAPNLHHAFYVSPAYEKIWGQPSASIYEDPLSFMRSIHPDDLARVLAAMPKQVEGTYDEEYRIVRPDGEVRWIRDRAFPIKNEQGKVYRVAGIAEDITERKQIEQHLLELSLERERSQILRDFIGDATHDLKTPLASMTLKLEMLRMVEDSEERSDRIDSLQTQLLRLSELIDDMLLLSRLDYEAQATVTALNVNQLLLEIFDTTYPLASAKSLDLVLDLGTGDLAIQGSKTELRRALTNLIENAIYYTEVGSVQVRTCLENGFVMIKVVDTGIGIDKAEQAFVFNRFYRAKKQTDRGGSGLGLAIVKKVIDRHRGTINLESRLGEGTTFTILFPVMK